MRITQSGRGYEGIPTDGPNCFQMANRYMLRGPLDTTSRAPHKEIDWFHATTENILTLFNILNF